MVYRYYSSFPSWLGGFDSHTLLQRQNNTMRSPSAASGIRLTDGVVFPFQNGSLTGDFRFGVTERRLVLEKAPPRESNGRGSEGRAGKMDGTAAGGRKRCRPFSAAVEKTEGWRKPERFSGTARWSQSRAPASAAADVDSRTRVGDHSARLQNGNRFGGCHFVVCAPCLLLSKSDPLRWAPILHSGIE